MKAPSLVLDSVQRPTTFYGLPPRMAYSALAMAAIAGFLAWHVLVGFFLAFVVFLASAVAGLARCWAARARDPHVEQVGKAWLFWGRGLGWRFWRGRNRKFRHLAAAKPDP